MIQQSVKAGTREFFKDRDHVTNLVLSIALWAVTIMNYQINNYYPNYFPGDDFQNLSMISTVELIAYIAAGILYDSVKSKKTTIVFVVSFAICIFGGAGLLVNDKQTLPYNDLIFNYICKFGIASAFQGVYLASELFPVAFASTTFGVCNLSGVISGFFSKYVYAL